MICHCGALCLSLSSQTGVPLSLQVTAGCLEARLGSRGLDMCETEGHATSCHLVSLLQKQFVIVKLNH